MEVKQEQEVFCFVGCGGTFWAANPYLQQILIRRAPGGLIFCDPDIVETKNTQRQWCSHAGRAEVIEAGGGPKACKVDLANDLFRTVGGWVTDVRSQKFNPRTLRDREELDLYMIVNVDNDQARLQCVKACQEWREGRAICIMSGCVRDYGQVYYGAWQDRNPIHNFLPLHPDIGDGGTAGTGAACGEQTIFSNVITGMLLGRALEHVLEYHVEGRRWDQFVEYYWGRNSEDVPYIRESIVKPVVAVTDFEEEVANA